MRKRYVLSWLASILAATLFVAQPSRASDPNIVISQIQLGNVASAYNEFIEIYNNSPADIEITNWCLYYVSATTAQTANELACFLPGNDSIHLFLPSHSFAYAISNQLALSTPNLGSDLKFTEALSGTTGYVRLLDVAGSDIDKVGWGAAAVSAEGASPVSAPPAGKVLQRKTSDSATFQDTNVNSADFESAMPRAVYVYGSISEMQDMCRNLAGIQESVPIDYTVDQTGNCLPSPVDICPNLDNLQLVLPPGYELDEAGSCLPDVCTNLAGLQRALPEGKQLDQSGACVDYDECANLSGIQAVLPGGYKLMADGMCMLDLLPVNITELLANPYGSDTGQEFIELYNPNDIAIDLGLYALAVGAVTPKLYSFPVGSRIEALSYLVFFNSDIPYTLVNTSSRVAVMTVDGVVVDAPPAYADAKDDMAWALIDGTWQYTNQPTPGNGNVPSFVESDETAATTSNLASCASNQYRSPETNRCRLLAVASSVLAPCKDGQYRSEATNRCRSIAGDAGALVLCSDDQERNPETNRCRLIATADTAPTACKQGQERNPATNRCRTSVAISAAAYPVEPVDVRTGGYIGWLAVGSVGVLAVGYGVWEWRSEIAQATQKLRSFFHHKK